MKILSLLFFALAVICPFSSAQKIPEGYILQYKQDFSAGKALSDFKFDDPESWGIFKVNSNFYLQCNDSNAVAAYPSNIAFINNKIFGDFIFEVETMPDADKNGVKEICLFLGARDFSKYYYIQLADRCDSSYHGIYVVKNGKNYRLTSDIEKPMVWTKNKWYKIKVVRNIVQRTILVYADNMTVPLLQIKDYELVMGLIGVGSYSGSAKFDNITIWAPTVLSEEETK